MKQSKSKQIVNCAMIFYSFFTKYVIMKVFEQMTAIYILLLPMYGVPNMLSHRKEESELQRGQQKTRIGKEREYIVEKTFRTL